jgi:transcriptional regulator with XRE-family HTH domain
MGGQDWWPGTDELGDRLRETLKLRGLTFRSAGEELKKAGVRGAHFTNLHAIAQGQIPSLNLIEGIARTLEVNPAWLAFGVGEPGLLWTRKDQQEYGVRDLPADVQHRVAGLAMKASARIEGRTLDDHFKIERLLARRIAGVLRLLSGSPLFVPLGDEPDSVLGAERIIEGLGYWLREEIDREEADNDPALSQVLELAPSPGGEDS